MKSMHSKQDERTSDPSVELVMAYQRALGEGDWKLARGYLDDNLSFKGPLAEYHTPEPYLNDLEKLHRIVKGLEMKKIFADEENVCLLYEMQTDTPAGTAFICEWHQIKNGKIKSIRVVFDARPFSAMFSEKH